MKRVVVFVRNGKKDGRANFLEKNIFRKKTAEGVAGVLARIFHPPTWGDPPAYPQDGSAKFGYFREKKIEKKFNLAEKMVKNYFFRYCILRVWDLY